MGNLGYFPQSLPKNEQITSNKRLECVGGGRHAPYNSKSVDDPSTPPPPNWQYDLVKEMTLSLKRPKEKSH